VATDKQDLGEFGEKLVAAQCHCPRCKRSGTLKQLPTNFRCADLICDFCGYLAQVKATRVDDIDRKPDTILGAAWGPQKERMDAGIYFPLFIVVVSKSGKETAIYYLSADLQQPSIFEPRKPLSSTAKRAGWQGFLYRLTHVADRLVRIR
jgi:type II restriction enzyme